VTKELDTSWFDLKNYEALKTMSIEDWIWQLDLRTHYHGMAFSSVWASHVNPDDYLLPVAERLKTGVIPGRKVPHNTIS